MRTSPIIIHDKHKNFTTLPAPSLQAPLLYGIVKIPRFSQMPNYLLTV